MFPVLFSIGPMAVHTYGALIVIGFLIGVYLIRQKCTSEKVNPDHMTDMAFWALLLGLVGGRILFIITLWEEFSKEPLEMLKFWNGGLVYYGGMIAGVATFLFLSNKYKISRLQAMDIAGPSLAIAHAFGRIGCFVAGCCFGRVCDPSFPLAVTFHHPESIAPLGVPLHPAQLYDAANAFIVFFLLNWLFKRRKFDGQIAALYFMVYAVGRTIVESFRGDSIRGFVIPEVLSTSQFISIFVFLTGVFLYVYARKRNELHGRVQKGS